MNRRSEILVVALLLVGCVGVILFVFLEMSRHGGSFTLEEAKTPPLPAADRPRAVSDRVPDAPVPPPGRKPEDAPPLEPPVDEAPPSPVAPAPETEPEGEPPAEEDHSGVAATLYLEMLSPGVQEDRRVRVTAHDVTGVPVGGALVVFREGGSMLYRERTDAAGVAAFSPYPDEKGPFRVDAVARGFLAATAESAAAGADIELILEARPILEGRVRAPTKGRGVVRLFLGQREIETKVRNDGTFLFEGLDPGYVTVQAIVEPYGADEESFFLEAGTRRYVSLNVRADTRARIYGEVDFWPGEGAMWINGTAVAVNPSGRYTYEGAVIGVNEVVIDAPGKAPLRERFEVKGRAKSRYDFRLRREARLKGRVRNERTRRPVPNAMVRVGFDRGDPRNDRALLFPVARVPLVKTDERGRFEVGRLDRRMIYLVSVVADGYAQFLGDAVPDGGFLDVALPEGPYLFGKVRGRGGLPRGAVVTARPLEEAPGGRYFNVEDWDRSRGERGREGFYGLSGLLPGPYLLRVTAPNFGAIETVVDLTDRRRLRFDLRLPRGAEVDEETAQLLRRLPPAHAAPSEGALSPGDVTSLFVDVRRPLYQEPFNGVRVLFFENEEEWAPPMDFAEENFELVGLPEATYRAILHHPLLKKPIVREDIVLRRGKPFTVDFR